MFWLFQRQLITSSWSSMNSCFGRAQLFPTPTRPIITCSRNRYYTSACCAGIFDTTCTPELIGPKVLARSMHVLHSIMMTLTYIGRVWLSFACLLYIRTAAVDLIYSSKLRNCIVLPQDHPRSCVIRLSYRQYKKKYQRNCSPGT